MFVLALSEHCSCMPSLMLYSLQAEEEKLITMTINIDQEGTNFQTYFDEIRQLYHRVSIGFNQGNISRICNRHYTALAKNNIATSKTAYMIY